jgi:hypothetical protein
MARRLAWWARAGVAAVGVTSLLTGCEAEVRGDPPAPGVPPPSIVDSPVAAPPTQPAATFAGLDGRVQQAASDAAASGADITTVILDRTTGQVVSSGADTAFPIASVVKLFIADDLLLQEAKGETTLSPAERASLDRMLRSSDDGAAQTFWDRSGGNDIIGRVTARYGLTGTTAPSNGHWDVTQSTANDLVRYYQKLLDGSGGLPPSPTGEMLTDLAQFTPTGIDGYPQRFGIPEGLYAEPVAVKQGWFCCWNGGNQLHVSTGAIGADRRYVMAVSSLDPSDEAGARQNITDAVKTMFPGGVV